MKKFSVGILAMIMVLAIAGAASAHEWHPITEIENLILQEGYVCTIHTDLPNLQIMPIVLLDGQMAMSAIGRYSAMFTIEDSRALPAALEPKATADRVAALGMNLTAGRYVTVIVSYMVLNGEQRAVQVVGVGEAQWAREIPAR